MVGLTSLASFVQRGWEAVPQHMPVWSRECGSQPAVMPSSCGRRMLVLRFRVGSPFPSLLLSSHLGDCLIRSRWLGSLYYISNYPVAQGFLMPYLHTPEPHLNSTVIILTASPLYGVRITATSFWKGFVLFTCLGNRSSHPVSCTVLGFPAHFWHYSATTVKICLTCQLPANNNCIISSIKISVSL